MPVLWAEPLIYLKSLSSDVRPRLPSRMVLPRRVAPKVPRLVPINLLSTLPSTTVAATAPPHRPRHYVWSTMALSLI